MENDKLTQIYINTKNISALVEQLKIIQAEQQINISKLNTQSQQIAALNADLQNLRQQLFILKAAWINHGPTSV